MTLTVKIILIVILILLLILMILGFSLSAYSMAIRGQTLEGARKWQEEHYDLSFYDQLEKTDYTVESYDGYILHAQFLKNPVPTDRYMLITHGYTDNRFGSLKYTKMYLDLGFNVVIYDLRGHGMNKKTFVSYSIRESRDLDIMIKDCRNRYKDISFFGIQGESLGSASSVAVCKYRPDIDFIVADCGFSEIIPIMKNGLRGFHLPPCLVHVASLCTKIRFGYFYYQMRPIDSLADNRIPILFIHGAEDDFIAPWHSEVMNKATKGYSEVYLIPGAQHANSVLTDPVAYKKYVSEFILKISEKND